MSVTIQKLENYSFEEEGCLFVLRKLAKHFNTQHTHTHTLMEHNDKQFCLIGLTSLIITASHLAATEAHCSDSWLLAKGVFPLLSGSHPLISCV